MHVLIAGKIEFETEECAAIITSATEFILSSRAESGCIAYEWSVDPLSSNTIHVFEEWASEQALLHHFSHSSYASMRDHLQQNGMKSFSINLYGATNIEPVYLPGGVVRTEIFGTSIA